MYYQTRVNELLPVANAMEAATMIKNMTIAHWQCPTWKEGEKQITVVADGHCDNLFLEVAVLQADKEGYTQIESITAGWVDSPEELANHFIQAAKEPCVMGKASFIVGTVKGDEIANFTCGCCGSWFIGNVKKQHAYDQDAGYGICPNCEKYH